MIPVHRSPSQSSSRNRSVVPVFWRLRWGTLADSVPRFVLQLEPLAGRPSYQHARTPRHADEPSGACRHGSGRAVRAGIGDKPGAVHAAAATSRRRSMARSLIAGPSALNHRPPRLDRTVTKQPAAPAAAEMAQQPAAQQPAAHPAPSHPAPSHPVACGLAIPPTSQLKGAPPLRRHVPDRLRRGGLGSKRSSDQHAESEFRARFAVVRTVSRSDLSSAASGTRRRRGVRGTIWHGWRPPPAPVYRAPVPVRSGAAPAAPSHVRADTYPILEADAARQFRNADVGSSRSLNQGANQVGTEPCPTVA